MESIIAYLMYPLLYSSALSKAVWLAISIIPVVIIIVVMFVIWRRKMRANRKITGIAISVALLSVLMFSAYKNCRWMLTHEYVAA